MPLFRLLTLLLLCSLVPVGGATPAYGADPLVDLPGSIPPVAARAIPSTVSRPEGSDDDRLIQLTVVLTPRDEVGLQARAAAARGGRQTALSPHEFAIRHAPAEATFNQVRSYLRSYGLSITYESADRLMIGARGPRAAAEAAFDTTATFVSDGERNGFVNTTPLRLPASLAGAIKAVAGFDELSRKQVLGKLKPIDDRRRGPDAAELFDPRTIRKAYNVDALGLNGFGAKIAIILWASPTVSPVAAFNQWGEQFGFSNLDVTIDGQEMYPYVTDDARKEADMDIQLALAVAPRAKITFYVAAADKDAPLLQTTKRAIDQGAHVISNSWGGCETDLSESLIQAWHQLFNDAAVKNVTVVAASGDKGLFQCGTSRADTGIPMHPASDPLVNAIGGTRLFIDQSTLAWENEVGWSCNGVYTPSSPKVCRESSSGGGTSTFWEKPHFQRGRGSGSMRSLPDYSSNADRESGMYVLLGGYPDLPIGAYQAGGTSAAAPWVAGLLALAVQGNGGQPIGDPRPVLYDDPYDSGLFDVTLGYNGESASGGYDRVTGLGSIRDAARFVATLVPGIEPPPTASPKLIFNVQPVGGLAGAPLAIQPLVGARDADGRVLTYFTGPVTIRLKSGSGPSDANLTGTTTVTPVGGVASFTDLSIDKSGAAYVLVASSGGSAEGVESVPFSVAPAPLAPKPDAFFPAVRKGINGGKDQVGTCGQGNGGQNDHATGGQKVKRGKSSKPVKFATGNRGNVADAFRVQIRLVGTQGLPPGLDISVGGLPNGATTDQLEPGHVQARDIKIATTNQTPAGSYAAIIDVISQSDPSKCDSVSLYFQVK